MRLFAVCPEVFTQMTVTGQQILCFECGISIQYPYCVYIVNHDARMQPNHSRTHFTTLYISDNSLSSFSRNVGVRLNSGIEAFYGNIIIT